MRSSLVAIVVGLAVGCASGCAAAEEPAHPEGPRVRVTSAAAPSGRLVGTLVGLDEEAVTVRPSKEAAVIGAATGDDCHGGEYLCFSGTDMAAMLAVLGAPAGALIGLAVSHGEKWETTSPDGLRVAITPTRGGAALRVSFGF